MKQKPCPACGHDTANAAKCPQCGKRLRMSPTRAVVSFVLLAAGVVGVRYAFATINHAAEDPGAQPPGASEVRAKVQGSPKPTP